MTVNSPNYHEAEAEESRVKDLSQWHSENLSQNSQTTKEANIQYASTEMMYKNVY